ncbi:MAG: phosphate/phosphite/phosphonate ABC transporter substrate-binding protein [Chloroflexi bacterium]|nr:phosphate/phosphite/phosphonate ABC transporter substrate-binding protein [Chloroflexota bacterium]
MLTAALAVWLLAGCAAAEASALPYVDLTQRAPVPLPTPSRDLPLRLAVAAIISPQGNIESYNGLARYLEEQLEREVEIVQRRTYAEVNQLVANRRVDLAFVCTSAYVDGRDRFGMELLAAPQINGETVYYSELIVPANSRAQGMADLRGKVFAFTDPMSFSGRVYPTYLLQQLGERPEDFFSRTFFTYSHDKAIQAVADGVADGAAVDSLVLDYAIKRDPALQNRIRIIRRSPPFGIPPVVAPPTLSPMEKLRLQEILLTMHENPKGREVLASLGIDRFVRIDDQAYQSARDLIYTVGVTQP